MVFFQSDMSQLKPVVNIAAFSAYRTAFRGNKTSAGFRKRNIEVRPLVWYKDGELASTDSFTIIRQTWDYIDHYTEFLDWISRFPPTKLHNPAPGMKWNSHKFYLKELASCGVAVIPTEYIAKSAGAVPDVAALMASRGWQQAIIKPAVSCGSYRTLLLQSGDCGAGQALLAQYHATEDFLLQRYIPSLRVRGELSLVFIDGTLTHAFRKQPPADSFSMIGAALTAVSATESELALAHAALAALRSLGVQSERDPALLYARVDMVNDDEGAGGGAPLLMELELIEPCLFYDVGPQCADALAEAIARRAAQQQD